jgi:hypothetical protein
LVALVVFLPLLAAAIAGFFGRVIGDRGAQIVTCGALLLSAAFGILVFRDIMGQSAPQIETLATGFPPAPPEGSMSPGRCARYAVGRDDPRRDHRLVDGPHLFDRLHGP